MASITLNRMKEAVNIIFANNRLPFATVTYVVCKFIHYDKITGSGQICLHHIHRFHVRHFGKVHRVSLWEILSYGIPKSRAMV